MSISSNCVLTVINASAAVTLLEQRPEKIQALSGIRTHDLCDASAVLSQLSYQSHMRAVVCGLALYICGRYTWPKYSTVRLIVSISSNCVLTVINASAAVTPLEQRPEKIQALSGIRTHELCDASAVLSQLSYQSHMRAVVCG